MRLLCFLAAFLLTAGLQAQIDYLPGYYIGVGGVKKECFIKSSVSADITKNLFYKLTESGPENEMRLHEVFEFGIYGTAVYKKFTVDIDKSTTEISRLRTSNTPQWEPETLFLKLVVHGKIDLYETASRNNKYFYFSEGMEKPVQLLYIEYTDANDSKILRYDYTFRKQLYELMGDKGYPVTQFRKLEYKKKPLVKLFLTYNGITPGKIQMKKTIREK